MNETTGLLITKYGTGCREKTTAVDDGSIVKAVKKNPKTTGSDINNNVRDQMKVSEPTV